MAKQRYLVGGPCGRYRSTSARKKCNTRVSSKIRKLRDEGMGQSQAVAVALAMESEGRLGPRGGYKKAGRRAHRPPGASGHRDPMAPLSQWSTVRRGPNVMHSWISSGGATYRVTGRPGSYRLTYQPAGTFLFPNTQTLGRGHMSAAAARKFAKEHYDHFVEPAYMAAQMAEDVAEAGMAARGGQRGIRDWWSGEGGAEARRKAKAAGKATARGTKKAAKASAEASKRAAIASRKASVKSACKICEEGKRKGWANAGRGRRSVRPGRCNHSARQRRTGVK